MFPFNTVISSTAKRSVQEGVLTSNFYTNYTDFASGINCTNLRLVNGALKAAFLVITFAPAIILSSGEFLCNLLNKNIFVGKNYKVENFKFDINEFIKINKIAAFLTGLSLLYNFLNLESPPKVESQSIQKLFNKTVNLQNIFSGRYQTEYSKMARWMTDSLVYPIFNHLTAVEYKSRLSQLFEASCSSFKTASDAYFKAVEGAIRLTWHDPKNLKKIGFVDYSLYAVVFGLYLLGPR